MQKCFINNLLGTLIIICGFKSNQQVIKSIVSIPTKLMIILTHVLLQTNPQTNIINCLHA